MNLTSAKELAIKKMEEHDLIEKGWKFSFDNAKRRFGACHHHTKKISLSKDLVVLNDEKRVLNTILHEIAHALVGAGHGHDNVWKRKALEIGCNGERCYSSDNTKTPKGKYIAVCNGCGESFHKFVIRKNSGREACRACCDGIFNEKYVLVYKKVDGGC